MPRLLGLLIALSTASLAGYDAAGVAGRWLIDGYKLALSPLQPASTCTFEPTCSQLTRQAIEAHGLVTGVVIGADRLLRCQPLAWTQRDRAYIGMTGDRLNDPLANHIAWSEPPSGPSTDMPVTSQPADSLAAESEVAQLEFARWLWNCRDWHRAGIEFTRAFELASDSSTAVRAGLMAGEAFLLSGEPGAARAGFISVAASAGQVAYLGAARADFAAGRYDSCRAVLSRHDFPALRQESATLAGWCLLRERRFAEGAAVFESLAEPDLQPLAAMTGQDIPHRSRALATILSALVPGAGQLYSGRAGDGAYSFLVVAGTGLITWWFASDARHRDRTLVKTAILGTTAVVFHAGNIYGANIAARDFNRLQESRYIAQADELLSHIRLAPELPWPAPGRTTGGDAE